MKHIAYCFDKNYRQHFGASLLSLLLNYKLDASELVVHVVTDTMDGDFREKLKGIENAFKANLVVHELSDAEVLEMTHLPKARMSQFSSAIYFRLLLPVILDRSIDKVLYLDSDTIILDSVHPILEADVHGYAIAAVPDYAARKNAERLGLGNYVNSGVLLMNLDVWRERSLTPECLQWLANNPDKALLGDQCAINVVNHDSMLLLNGRWNCYVVSGEEPRQDNPAILHFITSNKPWHAWHDNEYGKFYWQYLNVSPWMRAKAKKPETLEQALRLARLLQKQGKHSESNRVYENILHTIFRKPRPGDH